MRTARAGGTGTPAIRRISIAKLPVGEARTFWSALIRKRLGKYGPQAVVSLI